MSATMSTPSPKAPWPTLAPLVVAGGSLATGRELARQAGATGREARLVDEPGNGRELRAALDGAAAVAVIPARTVSVAGGTGAGDPRGRRRPSPPDRRSSSSPDSRSGTVSSHALNTPERLADRRRAETLVRASGVPYTIVRPTWLTSDPPGHYAVTLTQDAHADGMIARADLAAVCLAAVAEPAARGTTFAVFAQPGRPPRSWAPLFSALRRDAA